ncbi:MAG: PCRF domain-containing protein, partial [Candidatus Vogelbacteria bacterium]|nr:PCRF domain-containing protein [Candidatus Vogelbacteria bacterium]
MDLADFKANNKTAYLAGLYEDLTHQINEARSLALADESVKELVEEEIKGFEKQQADLLAKMTDILTPKIAEGDFAGPRTAMIEIRAGAGGEEASLFAYELAQTYAKYSATKGWAFDLVDESTSPS